MTMARRGLKVKVVRQDHGDGLRLMTNAVGLTSTEGMQFVF